MKLILNQEVPNLGAPGDVVEVKDGYGRNYLVPRGFAQLWTKGADKQIASIKRAREVREVRDTAQATEIKTQLAGLTVTLPARSGDGGRLFGSITSADVVDAVTRAGGPKLDRRLVQLTHPIKSLGQHTVAVKVHPEVEATLTLEVVKA
ncbi:MAG: 50S ribosomal protein L9 [Actinobacteria bacterium]|nr:50S ribosomal protein L9 [Actinomycetota bacterium]MCA1720478.1 50S ribosomal protein L9 [Actinomycetota bacterium]